MKAFFQLYFHLLKFLKALLLMLSLLVISVVLSCIPIMVIVVQVKSLMDTRLLNI